MMLNLPEEFLKSARHFAGDEFDAFINSLNEKSPVSIRLNPFKQSNAFADDEMIPWSVNGRYLNERPSFTLDPLFHAGCYYVQDASSQFLEIPFTHAKKILDRPLRILDLCAAPGGKSTHILSMIGEEDVLVSNEIISSRNNILRQNISKWGCSNVIVIQNDSSQLAALEKMFDIILVDAPCSGEGLFRKDPEAINEWSVDNVNRCAVRQNVILDAAVKMLKADGILIYSTCTFEKVENDDQVKRLAEKHALELLDIEFDSKQIVKTDAGVAFFPHRIKGEGFYVSMLRKNSDSVFSNRSSKIKIENKKMPIGYLNNPEKFNIYSKEEQIFAIPKIHFDFFTTLKNECYVRLAGIHLGEMKGKDFIPSESLALSNEISKTVSSVQLSKDDALNFLRGLNISVDTENGFHLVTYEGHNLGWIKKIEKRVNNYYPKEWRIRK
jgi:16S rRNA C967 or C1407 C5-methylase (RsmB/RsmF family)/NOL1/NOP2/fmu family ribosome biogenesis protein